MYINSLQTESLTFSGVRIAMREMIKKNSTIGKCNYSIDIKIELKKKVATWKKK